MTPAALNLLRRCAARTILMRSTDAEWEAAQELIDGTYARFDYTMRGGYAAGMDRGRAELELVERLADV